MTDPSDSDAPGLWLSEAELRRASGIARSDNRARYITGRRALRTALGQLLGHAPAAVTLEAAAAGAPRAVGACCSLSHSGPWALAAVSAALPLGVDVQSLRPRDCSGLAAQLGWRRMQARLARLSPADQARTFMPAWARAEALLKALGLPELPCRGLDWTEPLGGPAREGRRSAIVCGHAVTVTDLKVAPGFAAALAVLADAGTPWQLQPCRTA